MKKTLLDKARAHRQKPNRGRSHATDEHAELAIAFLKGEVGITDVAKVIGGHPASAYRKMMPWVRLAFRNGWLKDAR